MTSRVFGLLPSGEAVQAHTLSNEAGASAEVLTYGGILRSLRMPDGAGRVADVVLGLGTLEGYLAGHPYMGAIVGRIAGRVSGGRLLVGGRVVSLDCNDGSNHLHGGRRGFDKRLWTATPVPGKAGASSVRLSYVSPDGEEGYPGNVEVSVTYTLTAENALVFETEARSDRATPLSLTHHSYFNLEGEGTGPVLGHEVQILAGEYVPADSALTLQDRRERVSGRSADFNRPRPLRDAIPGLPLAHGDLYLLRAQDAPQPKGPLLAARVVEPRTGRILEVSTDEPCLQFYSGVGLDGSLVGKSGRPYGRHAGLCLECQGYPNAASVSGFGDIMVSPERPLRRCTVYAFSTVSPARRSR